MTAAFPYQRKKAGRKALALAAYRADIPLPTAEKSMIGAIFRW